jgi:D-alanyl-D-alanine carboxypeptidase
LEYFDEDVYRAIVSRLTLDSAYTFRPQELSNLCWALATAGVEVKYPDAFDTTLVPKHLRPSAWKDDPVTICFEAAASELMRRPHEFKTQEIKDILWSCSKVSI